MTETFFADREAILNKYHRLDRPYNSFQRFAYHGWECDLDTGLDDAGIKEKIREACESRAGQPHPVVQARAFAAVLDNTRIAISPHDWYVGIYGWGRLPLEFTRNVWNRQLFEKVLPDTAREMAELNRTGTVTLWPDYDHSVPDWDAVFRLGFPGLLERVKRYHEAHRCAGALSEREEAFFQGMEITYEAILRFLQRLRARALALSHAKAAGIAACLGSLLEGGPQDTYQALQLIYLYFMFSESIDGYQVRSLASGLDQALEPFIRADLAARRYTSEQIDDFIAYFLLQFAAIDNYWGQPMYMGGSNEKGESLVCETSYRILRIYDEMGIFNPKIQLKIAPNTPRDFVDQALDMIRRGHSSIVWMCEPGIVRAMMSKGVPYEEAVTCDIKGCYEYSVRAREVSLGQTYLNLSKFVLLALRNGRDERTGEQIGPQTGAPETFTAFGDLWKAFLRQTEHFLRRSLAVNDAFEPYIADVSPSNVFSATIENALRTKRDAYQDGSIYNNSVVLFTGFASAIDALMAVKTLVYEEKRVSLADLLTALDANWAGYEKLRAYALRCPHKYGNGDVETDRYAQALATYLTNRINARPNTRGGYYKTAMHSARQYIDQGKKTGATPDGRRDGEELSKNSSAVMGVDKNGVTALAQSVASIAPWQFTEDFGFDVMLHASATAGEDGLKAMHSLLDAYMRVDGVSIQFNVFDAATLRDAQAHPEQYANLQVRVCGWNVLWNNMPREEQDAFLRRAEAIV